MSDTFKVCESVGFQDAQPLMEEVDSFIEQSGSDIQIDFEALVVTNSLVVAMMMSWYRSAALKGKTINFLNLPAGVQKIVEISGLDHVLPIKK